MVAPHYIAIAIVVKIKKNLKMSNEGFRVA